MPKQQQQPEIINPSRNENMISAALKNSIETYIATGEGKVKEIGNEITALLSRCHQRPLRARLIRELDGIFLAYTNLTPEETAVTIPHINALKTFLVDQAKGNKKALDSIKQQLVSSVSLPTRNLLDAFILNEKGNPKKIATAIIKQVKQATSYNQRHAIIQDLSELFIRRRYMTDEGGRSSQKNSSTTPRIQGIKDALVSKLKGETGENWKSLLLGIRHLETLITTPEFHTSFPDGLDQVVNLRDQNRFREIQGDARTHAFIGSGYTGPQSVVVPEEHRRVEDSILLQRFPLPDNQGLVTLGAVADGLGTHQSVEDHHANRRAAKFAGKALARLLAEYVQTHGIEKIEELAANDTAFDPSMDPIFTQLLEEVEIKYGNQYTIAQGNASIIAYACIERPNKPSLLVIYSIGDCMLFALDKDKKYFDTLAGAKENGWGPMGIPHQFNPEDPADKPYTRLTKLQENRILVGVSDGIHDEFELLYQYKMPIAGLTGHDVTLGDRHILNDGQIVQTNRAELDKAKVKTKEKIPHIANINSHAMEPHFKEYVTGTATHLAHSVMHYTVNHLNARREQSRANGATYQGDDISLLAFDPTIPDTKWRDLTAKAATAQQGVRK